MQLKGKVAIITGSARGLGKEIAVRFIQEGAKVTMCDILDCTEALSEILNIGGESMALKTDVTSEAEVTEMICKTVERFGHIDILVNNAAIFGNLSMNNFIKPFDQISSQEWDRLMDVNVKGIFLCCKAVVPYMKKQGHGKIVNIASTVAYSGSPGFLHYTTSKGGVVSMTRGLAMGLGEFNITVNAVAPGIIITESSLSMADGKMFDGIVATQAIKRAIKPEDVAGSVAFLASADADLITGHVLAVNGGEYLF
jgi:NAD(P)-dependent dehydrogenase (short-subunit alcohol dehydrogenase family)